MIILFEMEQKFINFCWFGDIKKMMLLIEWREILVRGISRVGYKKLLIFCCYKEIDGKVGI